ncbi:MAG: hypothetical protein PHC62_10080 [Candidatus Izemoplasmatales bacterium]|nr:hypothetical protein [Candidatus Izemoplasmatales bacterium]
MYNEKSVSSRTNCRMKNAKRKAYSSQSRSDSPSSSFIILYSSFIRSFYKRTSLFIIHYSLFILLILTLMSCGKSSTQPKSASLTGTISLVNDSGDAANDQTDFSGITVALYNLAELDTTIVRINRDYPQIGIKITQHTEFDHLFQTPVAYTETSADGSFSLQNLTPNTQYNLVALKDGWGWRYVYEISLSEGDNELADVMEQSRLNYRTVEQKRNFAMNNDREMNNEKSVNSRTSCTMNNAKKGNSDNLSRYYISSLERSDSSSHYSSSIRQSRTKVLHSSLEQSDSPSEQSDDFYSSLERSDSSSHYSSFIIHYSLSNDVPDLSLYPETEIAGLVENSIIVQPFHHLIASDDVTFAPGSYFELQPNSVCRIAGSKSVEIYGSVKMQGEENGMFTVTSNELTYNHKSDDYFNTFKINSNVILLQNIEQGKWSRANTSLTVTCSNINIASQYFNDSFCSIVFNNSENNECRNLIIKNSIGESEGGIYFSAMSEIQINKTIFSQNYNAIRAKDTLSGSIADNFFISNSNGIHMLFYSGDIVHNEFNNDIDIYFTGDMDVVNLTQQIRYNNFNGINGIVNYRIPSSSFYPYFSQKNINFNNFKNHNFFLNIRSLYYNLFDSLDCQSNFFLNSFTETEIYKRVIISDNIQLDVSNYLLTQIEQSGIRQ